MLRPVTLFTGQWADLPLETLARLAKDFGYDGLELACWGDHVDVTRASRDRAYAASRRELLNRHGLELWAISAHLVGQAVCDRIDDRHRSILPPHVWGDGDPEGVRRRAAAEMVTTARAAAAIGVTVVNGFTGSSIWPDVYFFPPTDEAHIAQGYQDFADRWGPILDAFAREGVTFALEVHPTEIAYDIPTARRAIDAVHGHAAFAFNFDPSHLHWQFVDPVRFIRAFPKRIAHVHVKDCARTLDGEASILGSHLGFGDSRRGWDFRSPGRGEIDFERVIRALDEVGYSGPLSVEWEDSAMDRQHGAKEACVFVRKLMFPGAARAFDRAFGRKDEA